MKVNVPFSKRHPLALRVGICVALAAPGTFFLWKGSRDSSKSLSYCADTRRRIFEIETLLEAEGIVKKAAQLHTPPRPEEATLDERLAELAKEDGAKAEGVEIVATGDETSGTEI
jgi:hypothetical protein